MHPPLNLLLSHSYIFPLSLTVVCSCVPYFSFQYVVFLLSVLSVPSPSYSSISHSLLFSFLPSCSQLLTFISCLCSLFLTLIQKLLSQISKTLFSYKINQHFASKILLTQLSPLEVESMLSLHH